MGLPGSGKTTLARKLSSLINAKWLNADKIRKKYNDWDFSKSGTIRQSKRMFFLAKKLSKKNYTIADFICPTPSSFKYFKADLIVWMDTIKKGRFKNMNKLFVPPKKYDLRVTTKNADLWKYLVLDKIKKYKWNNKAPSSLMLGRFQPWHFGHRTLFEEIFKKYGQVNIQVKDVNGLDDNPFKFSEIKKKIQKDLKIFKNRIKISKTPNIYEINFGRKVGYKIKKINLPKKIQLISATKIRENLRKKNFL